MGQEGDGCSFHYKNVLFYLIFKVLWPIQITRKGPGNSQAATQSVSIVNTGIWGILSCLSLTLHNIPCSP